MEHHLYMKKPFLALNYSKSSYGQQKGNSCFSTYKALPSGFFIAGLCLHKLHVYVVKEKALVCVC